MKRIRRMPLLLLGSLGLTSAIAFGGQDGTEAPALPPVWTYEDHAAGRIPEAKSYTVRKEHPRLFITPETRGRFVEKAKAAPEIWKQVIAAAEIKHPSTEQVWDTLLCCALIYQTGCVPGYAYGLDQKGYGQKGLGHFRELFEMPSLIKVRESFVGSDRKGSTFDTCAPMACAYDWLHDLLSEGDRKSYVRQLPQFFPWAWETGCTPTARGMLLPLACYGDGVDDELAGQLVQKGWTEYWWNPKQTTIGPLRLIASNTRSGHAGGFGYWTMCGFPSFPGFVGWGTATGQNLAARLGYLSRLPYMMAYQAIPSTAHPWQRLRLHYTHGDNAFSSGHMQMTAAATGYLRDCDPVGASLARWVLEKSTRGMASTDSAILAAFILGDPTVKARSPSELRLPKFLDTSPYGSTYFRSAWEDPDATVLGMHSNQVVGYRFPVSNNLAVWSHGGHLFPIRGYNKYGFDYKKWGGNRVVILEGSGGMENEHVVGRAGGNNSTEEILAKGKVGDLTHSFQDDHYYYVRNDDRKHYTRLDYLEKTERTLVFFPEERAEKGGFLLVMDRLWLGWEVLKPHVVFSSVFEPWLGADWEREDKGTLKHEAHWRTENTPCVRITNNLKYQYGSEKRGDFKQVQAHARAFMRILSPKRFSIWKIGGEDHFLDNLQGKQGQIYGKAIPKRTSAQAGGFWRFQIVPGEETDMHQVVVAIEITDSKVQRPHDLVLHENPDMTAVELGDNLALFAGRKEDRLARGEIAVPRRAAYRVLLCDLKPRGAYTVRLGGETRKITATEAGTAFVGRMPLKEGDRIAIAAAGAGG